jgi:hypothetical protein
MAALQYVHVPEYSALLLRRTFPELTMAGSILDRAHVWLDGKVHWDAKHTRFEFPSGARLSFSFLQDERDKFRYKSSEFQFVGFDELTEFTETQYLYLLSRLRRRKTMQDVLIRMRGASNPGDVGHDWVKARFVEPGSPERIFVPALLTDNPHIDQEEYDKALAQLDATTRNQLRYGVWVADSAGLVYEHFSAEQHVIARKPEGDWRHILSLDFGYTDDCGVGVLGWPKHSRVVYVLESCKLVHNTPTMCAEFVKELEKRYRFSQIVGDVGGLGKGYAEEMRQRFALPITAAEKTNKRGYISLINGAFARNEILLLSGQSELEVELKALRWNKDRSAENPGQANHLTDMLLYGWRAAKAWAEPEAPTARPLPGTPEWYTAEERRMKDEEFRESRKLDRAIGLRLLGRRR